MEEDSIFLDYIGDNPRMRILQYLIEGRDFDYTVTDMLNSGVSWGTLNSIVPNLLKFGIIIKTRKIGRATLYKINKENVFSNQLIKLYDDLIMQKLNYLSSKKLKVKA